MMARKKQYEATEIASLFKEGFNRAISRPSIHGYEPHDKQVQFHSSPERGRLYIGGNRSGKTVGGVVEDIWRLRGSHPYLKVPEGPIAGRIVTTSYNEGVKLVIIPALQKWLPPSLLINGSWEDSYAKGERMLTLSNGSTCELMSYDQDLDKFAGTSRHFIHFDEEPPKDIFTECKLRLLDTGGSWWMTMTPVEGMTWVYDDIYLPGLSPGSGIRVVQIDTAENPYISGAEIEEVLAGLDVNERKARQKGEFVQIGGQVYKEFNIERNIIPPLEPEQYEKIKSWTHYASMDHGLNNPTAWLFHAVSPSGVVVTHDEIYRNETLIPEFARLYHERLRAPGRVYPYINVGDPAIAQRNAQTGDSVQRAYMRYGVPIVLGNNDVHISVNKINTYLKAGKWVITENCTNLLRELPRVRWKVFEQAKRRHDNNVREEIHKKDDHAPDSARYLFGLMPTLELPNNENVKRKPGREIVQAAMAATTPQMGPYYTDPNLSKKSGGADWHVVDETLGGWH